MDDLRIDVRGEDKPPLGVVPRNIWYSKRARDILRALADYNDCDSLGPVQVKWAEELLDIVRALDEDAQKKAEECSKRNNESIR